MWIKKDTSNSTRGLLLEFTTRRTTDGHLFFSILYSLSLFLSFSLIFLIPDHSDRCLQTVQPTAKALNLPIYVEHGSSFIPFFGKSNSLKKQTKDYPNGIPLSYQEQAFTHVQVPLPLSDPTFPKSIPTGPLSGIPPKKAKPYLKYTTDQMGF